MTGRIVLSDRGMWLDGDFVVRIVQAVAMDLTDIDGAIGVEYLHPCHCRFGCQWCKSDNETGERVGTTEVFIQQSDVAAVTRWVSQQQMAPTADHTQAIADKLAAALIERREMVTADAQRSSELQREVA